MKLNDIEFASGQEPESPVVFITLVRVSFTLDESELAKLLKKQRRSLSKHVKTVTRKQLLTRVMWDKKILETLAEKVTVFVVNYIQDEFEEAPRWVTVDYADESDLPYVAKIENVNGEMVGLFEVELDVSD